MIDPVLIETQRENEIQAIEDGVSGYYEKLVDLKPYHDSPYKTLVSKGMKTFVPAISLLQSQLKTGEPITAKGAKRWGPLLLSMDAKKLAWVTLYGMVNPIIRRRSEEVSLADTYGHFTHINYVASRLLKERHHDQLRENKAAYKEAQRNYQNWSGLAVDTSLKKANIRKDRWSQDDRLAIGCLMVRMALDKTQLFEEMTFYVSKKSVKTIMLRVEHLAWINKNHEDRALLTTTSYPMLIAPVPWDEDWSGGYMLDRYPFVIPKTTMVPHSVYGGMKKGLGQAYHAANIVQGTPFYFQPKVAATLLKLWGEGGGLANIIESEPRAYEEKPDRKVDPDAYQRYCRRFRRTHRHNIDTRSKRATMLTGLDTVAKFAKYRQLYYPARVDTRGRMYSMCHPISPQGDKNFRGLFRFARSKAVTDAAVDNIKIHLASCAGHDKLDFEERIKWVDENYKDIHEWAMQPTVSRGWMETDLPWLTLNACIELVDIKNGKKTTDLPVSRDGVCNGTQHYAALTLNEEDGKKVGLVPGDTPNDLYTAVKDKALLLLADKGRYIGQRRLANYWYTRLTRKIVKRPTMTTPYDVRDYGIQQQLFVGKHLEEIDPKDRLTHAKFLKGVLREAIRSVISSTTTTMAYLKSVASVCSAADRPLKWITPDGFPCHQEYRTLGKVKINLYDYRLSYNNYGDESSRKLKVAKQSSAFCPNFIHSLDGTHLRLTLASAYERGIEDFLMVHDSYGTHATDIDLLGVTLREEFIKMYESPLLEGLVSYLEEIFGLDLPSPPPLGTLDLSRVIDSEYFFH